MTPRVPPTLHLLTRETGGGTETNVRKLCAAVPGFELASLEGLGEWPLRPWNLPRAAAKLRAHNPRVVFCYGITAHLAALAAWPRRGPALVGNIRCVSDFSGWKGVARRAIAWRFSDWISNSHAALRGWRGRVIHNGIAEPPAESPLLPDLPKPVIGILASGHPKKGHLYFLALWKHLGRPGSLVFAGNLNPQLKQLCEAAGVLCPGFVAAGPLLRSLDLLVVPSTAEGIPTVLLEAMVRGVPCLATPVGGVGELVTHGRTGYVLPRRGWAGFLGQIDWEEARRIGQAGRAHVVQDFRFEAMAAGFADAAIRSAEGSD